jgi:hypothetical protein
MVMPPNAAANGGIALLLQSTRLVAVAELGSLDQTTMIARRQKIAWLAGMLLSALGILVLLMWLGREPSEQGRTLSQWLEALDNPSVATNVQTITAFHRMGAKAAVRLVPMLEASDSAAKLWAVELARKQTFLEVRFAPASVRWQRAEKGFEIMGEHAVAAAPGLVSLLVRRCAQPPEYLDDSADRAAGALVCLGYGGIPYLRPALYSEHARVRLAGAGVLVVIAASDETPGALAELFKLLDDSNPKVRKAGAYALGKIAQLPALVIPRLERVLADVSPSVRRQAAFALGRFGSRASNSMAALRQACSDVAPEVRHAAQTALTQIGGEAASSKDAGTSDLSDEK